MLRDRGISLSLSSVERILRRYNLTRKKKQVKLPYAKIQRPKPENPGALVEVDTIHFIDNAGKRFYIYVAIDVYSRIGYAQYSQKLSCRKSYIFTLNALKYFGFKVSVIQTDNGGEFAESFYFYLKRLGIQLRHTRVRKPNDNAHVERFIRTIQEECFGLRLPNRKTISQELKTYIHYYNHERYHLGINCNIPCLFVAKVLT
jgi:transposase InsO family protein